MIDQADLRAAVAAGILSEAQVAALARLSSSRQEAQYAIAAGDEPFEVFQGFNEIFIVVGFGILVCGWSFVAALLFDFASGGLVRQFVIFSLVSAIPIWAAAEYFSRKRRMVAPSIVLSLLWAAISVLGFAAALSEPFMLGQQDYSSLPLPLAAATLSVLLFWWRFRVPFALTLVAAGVFVVALLWTAVQVGNPLTVRDFFLLSSNGPFAWVTLIVGLAVFTTAMFFDMSDPLRVSRRSAQGFWLHIIAAPALVNTVALSLISQDTIIAHFLLFIILFLIAIVAIIIDRRSFLIAAAGYCVALSLTVFDDLAAAYIFVILGFFLVVLGATWERVRSTTLSILGPALPLNRLPPAA
ncbi:MAG: hypothetical protein OXC63_11850 [Aestuariivita sp.]|nr:hypothetical protein [Aestuariivita sp.]MCY4347354.1 hypothetical protein [Aestuariivita sp.]